VKTRSRVESRELRAARTVADQVLDTPTMRKIRFPSPRPSPSGRGRTLALPPAKSIASVRRTAVKETNNGTKHLPLPEGEGRREGERRVGHDSCSNTDLRPVRTFGDVQAIDSRRSTLGSRRGILLIDCLAYMALLAIILTMAFMAFYRAMEHARNLSRNAADIARALHAGEQWRADVRASTRPPRLETVGDEPLLRLVDDAREVNYAFRAGGVLRQSLPNTNWVELLPRVASSRMFEERRQHVGVWRWELELKGGQKVARVRSLFSFQAVANSARRP